MGRFTRRMTVRTIVAALCMLIAMVAVPSRALAYVGARAGAAGAVGITAGLPVTVGPASPANVTLNGNGAGTLSGTLTNRNGFHRWVRPVPVTVTGTSHQQCLISDITVTVTGVPANGAAVPPNSTRAWTATFASSRQQCKSRAVTVTYPATR